MKGQRGLLCGAWRSILERERVLLVGCGRLEVEIDEGQFDDFLKVTDEGVEYAVHPNWVDERKVRRSERSL